MRTLIKIEMSHIAGGMNEIDMKPDSPNMESNVPNKICCKALTPECLACMGMDYMNGFNNAS